MNHFHNVVKMAHNLYIKEANERQEGRSTLFTCNKIEFAAVKYFYNTKELEKSYSPVSFSSSCVQDWCGLFKHHQIPQSINAWLFIPEDFEHETRTQWLHAFRLRMFSAALQHNEAACEEIKQQNFKRYQDHEKGA